MSKIIFREKTISGKWVYWVPSGHLVGQGGRKLTPYAHRHADNTVSHYNFISELNEHKLLVDCTFGQWTGAVDKRCRKIFAGDIIKNTFKDGGVEFVTVVWDGGFCRFELEEYLSKERIDLCENEEGEVIGNIYDDKVEVLYGKEAL